MDVTKFKSINTRLLLKIISNTIKVLDANVYCNIGIEHKRYSSGNMKQIITVYFDFTITKELDTLEQVDTYIQTILPNYKSIYDNTKTTTPTKRKSRSKT